MTTQTQLTPSTRPTRKTHLRGPAIATALTALLGLGACSSEAPVTADPTRIGSTAPSTTSSTSTASETAAGTATPSASTTTTTPAPRMTRTPVKVTIKDPTLGHEIRVIEVRRNLAWPAGNPVGQEAFELISVKLELTAGDRYSASLSPGQLSLRLGKTAVKPTNEFGSRYGTLVKWVGRGQSRTGWLVFKIEHGVHPLVMQYHRPAYEVSTTDKTIKAAVIPRKLLD